ncbi:metallopeptidase family protein [Neomicrococcus lactis]|uniref:Putative Zn-dependent protease with MMP-like domain n=1 Tax=Neomicrococcus lactis TaxID=732241 RepID=A0A7W8YB45_9MICC|nr:metallopeptidase family protein [Neomicrococcus lactis]MBB5598275.1 putative Zn-dependent protease with MMP-like domain [Neomicrococcus lactis]
MSARFLFPEPDSGSASRGRSFENRRRNRHGRGLRGALLVQSLPGNRTREERFQDLVFESVEEAQSRFTNELSGMVTNIELVPPMEGIMHGAALGRGVPVGQAYARTPRNPPIITVFRRPVEEMSDSSTDLPDIVNDVVAELVGELLAVSPEEVDPHYGRPRRR